MEAAGASGYSVATINGLENHNEGSGRLRKRLVEIYALTKARQVLAARKGGQNVGAGSGEPEGDWKGRALRAEKALAAAQKKLEAIQRVLGA